MVAVPAIGLALLSAGEMAGVLRDGGDGPAGTGPSGGAIVLPDAVLRAAERESRGVPVEVVASVPRSGSSASAPGADAPASAPSTPAGTTGAPRDGARSGAGRGADEGSTGDSTVSGARDGDRAADAPASQAGDAPAAPASAPAPAPAAAPASIAPATGSIGAAAKRKLRLSVKSLDRIPATEKAPAALQLGVSVVDEASGKAASGLPETMSVKVAVPADQPATNGSASSLHVRLAMLDSRTTPSDDAPLTAADVALRVRLAFSDSEVDKPVLKRTSAVDEAVSSTLHVWVPLEKAPVDEPGEPGEEPGRPGEPGEEPGEPGEPGEDPGQPGEPAPVPQPEPLPVEDPEETVDDVGTTPDSAPAIDVVVPVSVLTPGESSSHEVEVPVADPSAPAPSAPVTVEVEGSAPPAEPDTTGDPVADPAPPVAPQAGPAPADASASAPEAPAPADADARTDDAPADAAAPADEPAE